MCCSFYAAGNIVCKLASVLLYPTVANSSADDLYSYVKYYAILVILSLLLSETICAQTY